MCFIINNLLGFPPGQSFKPLLFNNLLGANGNPAPFLLVANPHLDEDLHYSGVEIARHRHREKTSPLASQASLLGSTPFGARLWVRHSASDTPTTNYTSTILFVNEVVSDFSNGFPLGPKRRDSNAGAEPAFPQWASIDSLGRWSFIQISRRLGNIAFLQDEVWEYVLRNNHLPTLTEAADGCAVVICTFLTAIL